jgi:hypothetical protein
MDNGHLMKLIDALFKESSSQAYLVCDTEEGTDILDRAYLDWELEPIDGPTLVPGTVGRSGLFIVAGRYVTAPREYIPCTLA